MNRLKIIELFLPNMDWSCHFQKEDSLRYFMDPKVKGLNLGADKSFMGASNLKVLLMVEVD